MLFILRMIITEWKRIVQELEYSEKTENMVLFLVIYSTVFLFW